MQIFESNNFNYIKPNLINESSIYNLIVNHYIHILKLLIKNENVDINKLFRINKEKSIELKSLLYLATENRDIKIIQFLLDNKNIDVNFFSNYITKSENRYQCIKKTSLHLAVEKNYFEIVKLLLESCETCGNTYSISNELNSEAYFYESKIKEKNALYIAFENKYTDVLNFLLEKSFIDVNMKYYEYYQFYNGMNEKETTLLNIAISNNNIEFVNVLLSKPDIDVNIVFFIKEECSNNPFQLERYYTIL